jgi:hypothetical protein
MQEQQQHDTGGGNKNNMELSAAAAIEQVVGTVMPLPAPVRRILLRTSREGAQRFAQSSRRLDLQLDDTRDLSLGNVLHRFSSLQTMVLRLPSQLLMFMDETVRLPEGLRLVLIMHTGDLRKAAEVLERRPDVAAAVRIFDIYDACPSLFRNVMNMPHLETLRYRSSAKKDIVDAHIPIAPRLTNLWQCVTDMTPKLVREIAERAPRLSKLQVSAADYTRDDPVLDLSALSSLEHLVAPVNVIGHVLLPAATTTLTVLPSGYKLGQKLNLAPMHPGNVRHLDLSGNNWLTTLTGVTDSMPELLKLDIRGCNALQEADINAAKRVVPEVLL